MSIGDDSFNSQLTHNIQVTLRKITTANGYKYNVGAVEIERKQMQINDRYDFLLLLEEDPDTDVMYLREKNYILWFFCDQNDEIDGDVSHPQYDYDTEISYYNRNIIADVAVCLNVDITRGGFAQNTEVIPGTNDLYVADDCVLFGTWCRIKCVTDINMADQFHNR